MDADFLTGAGICEESIGRDPASCVRSGTNSRHDYGDIDI